MQLRLSLQRSEDEKLLFKHDLERYTAWVNELELNGKTLSEELQRERRKCKSLSESIVLQEAKVRDIVFVMHIKYVGSCDAKELFT